MNESLYPKSVYTIRHSNELDSTYKSGGTGSFIERKNWATACTMLEEAAEADQELPLILAYGDRIDGLRYWACIRSLEINDDGHTKVYYSGLTPISQVPPLSRLTLVNSNKSLRDDFFRPYAICFTPDFLDTSTRIEHAPDLEVDDVVRREEGGLVARVHFIRERDRSIIKDKKQSILSTGAKLRCECCDFDFELFYGPIGADYCEVHHLIPLYSLTEKTTTGIADLAVVCSNCHRMIHRSKPFLTIDQLRGEILKTEQGAAANP